MCRSTEPKLQKLYYGVSLYIIQLFTLAVYSFVPLLFYRITDIFFTMQYLNNRYQVAPLDSPVWDGLTNTFPKSLGVEGGTI